MNINELNFESKLWKVSQGTYVVTIPKAFIDAGILKKGKYRISIDTNSKIPFSAENSGERI